MRDRFQVRGWTLIPLGLIALLVVGLPVAALTETGIERDVKKALGFDLGECVPTTNLASPWQEGPELAADRDEPRVATIGGSAYLVGGINGFRNSGKRILLEPSDQLTRFDPRTGRYTELAPMPQPLNHIGVVSHHGDLYVAGGYGERLDTHTGRRFYRYDPRTNRWSRMPDLPEPRAAMALGVIGHTLVLAGGARDAVPSAKAFAFDFRTRRWSRLPDMHSRREHVGAAVVGDSLYVLGGRAPHSFAVDTAERLDLDDERWYALPPMPVPSGGLSAISVDGRVIAVGGGNDAAGTVTAAVQELDPASGEWSLLPGLRIARHGHGATAIGDRLWVFGGSDCAYFNPTRTVESVRLPALGSQ
jgi:Kelch motif protein